MFFAKAIIVVNWIDVPKAAKLAESLDKIGIHVTAVCELFNPKIDDPAEDQFKQLESVISNNSIVIFYVSQDAIGNNLMIQEITEVYSGAAQQGKTIITVAESDSIVAFNEMLTSQMLAGNIITLDMPEGHDESGSDSKDINTTVKSDYLPEQSISILSKKDELVFGREYSEIALKIYEIVSSEDRKKLLYEKVNALARLNFTPGIVSNLCELIRILCASITRSEYLASRRQLYCELLRCMDQLSEYSESGYSIEDCESARKKLEALDVVKESLKTIPFYRIDLFIISVELKANYLDYIIRSEANQTLSSGNWSGFSQEEIEEYDSIQSFLLKQYSHLLAQSKTDDTQHRDYSTAEFELIMHVQECLIRELPAQKKREEKIRNDPSEVEVQLRSVADLLKKSNKLLESANRSEANMDFYKCLLVCYERLKKYSEVVGCLSISAECVERIVEIKQYIDIIADKSSGSLPEYGIKAFLGYTLPGATDNDVFISYRHKDESFAAATMVYDFLSSNFIKPFMDKRDLAELNESDYHRAINQALDHSRNFILILADLQALDAPWIKYEMETFHQEIVEGRKRGSNFIFIVSESVYEEINSSNKTCLPFGFRNYQVLTLDNFKDSLVKLVRKSKPPART